MIVNGYKTEVIKVDVDPFAVLQELKKRWIFQTGKGDWIGENGHWYKEYQTSHSFYEKKEKATDDEIAIFNAFDLVIKTSESIHT